MLIDNLKFINQSFQSEENYSLYQLLKFLGLANWVKKL